MARALEQIMQELNATYNPQRDVYNSQIGGLDPQQDAELKGLQAQKEDEFGQITQRANRRGLFYSGLPIAEEQRYTGQQFLPAVANLRGKYANQRFGLMDALAKITQDQSKQAYGIYSSEVQADEERRQFDERMAAQAAQAATSRSSGGGGGAIFGGGYTQTPQQTQEQAPQLTLRQQWQNEAQAGDWDAQVALNYAGDDGRYDGPVNSQDEYNRLQNMGITGNYYVVQQGPAIQRLSTGSIGGQ